jgi:hypothetical protein
MKNIQERLGLGRIVIGLAILVIVVAVARYNSASKAGAAEDLGRLAGNWSGDSICVDRQSACHDEKVVYRISIYQGDTTRVKIQADKIVDEKPVTMGAEDYKFDRELGVLSHEDEHGAWKIVVNGNRLDGTMTVNGAQFRKLTLKKDE